MFISIIKELLGTKITECNEVYWSSYCQTLIDDEYESSNIILYLLRCISDSNLNHTIGILMHLSASK